MNATPRRVMWPVPACTLAFVLLGAWLSLALSSAWGLSPGSERHRFGTAYITDCERSPLELYLVHTCPARVEWRDEAGLAGPARDDVVTSLHELSGSVPVVERGGGTGVRGGELPRTTVPVNYPDRNQTMLRYLPVPLALMVGSTGLVLGFALSNRLSATPPPR